MNDAQSMRNQVLPGVDADHPIYKDGTMLIRLRPNSFTDNQSGDAK